MVSVVCTAYNHEKYIRSALEGFMMQKTSFAYEVWVHDDASTDGTADIIREYEKKYPDIIRPIYQKENQYSKGISITRELIIPQTRGKYIAICEGDDYWTDCSKLQKQFDALENNEECKMCVHKVAISKKGNLDGCYPQKEYYGGLINSEEVLYEALTGYPFQTSCYFMKKEVLASFHGSLPAFMNTFHGDRAYLCLYSQFGDFYYINQEMSVYRSMTEGSWSERHAASVNAWIRDDKDSIRFFENFNSWTKNKYEDLLNEQIDKRMFDIFLRTKDFRNVCSKKYLKYRRNFTYKARVAMRVCAIFPFMAFIWPE